jgi:hypothetical protein
MSNVPWDELPENYVGLEGLLGRGPTRIIVVFGSRDIVVGHRSDRMAAMKRAETLARRFRVDLIIFYEQGQVH